MGQAEMAVAGTATKTMEGRAPAGVFEPEELDGIGRHMDQRGLMLGGAVAQRVAAQMGHGLAGQFALTDDLCGPVSHGQTLQPDQSSPTDVVDEHDTGAVRVGCGQMILALSEGQLAQTEWLGTIRSLSGAAGLEVAQPVADTVRIGAGRVSLDTAQCDAALGGCAHDQQVVDELQQRSRRHAQPLSLVALALVGGDSGQCGVAVRVGVQGA
jgi:hypothetical protein